MKNTTGSINQQHLAPLSQTLPASSIGPIIGSGPLKHLTPGSITASSSPKQFIPTLSDANIANSHLQFVPSS